MRRLLFFAVALLLCQPAWAGNCVALVIGNSAYKSAAPLPNPANDAAIVDATLKNAGFDLVETRLDLQVADMRRALRDFAERGARCRYRGGLLRGPRHRDRWLQII